MGASGSGIREVFGWGLSSSSSELRTARVSPILTVSLEPGIWHSHSFPWTVKASDAQAARMHRFWSVSKKGFASTSRGCVKVPASSEFAWISLSDMADVVRWAS